jgi:hypothetical protein
MFRCRAMAKLVGDAFLLMTLDSPCRLVWESYGYTINGGVIAYYVEYNELFHRRRRFVSFGVPHGRASWNCDCPVCML